MSTSFGFACRDCKCESKPDDVRNDKTLQHIIDHIEVFAFNSDNTYGHNIEIEIKAGGHWINTSWLDAHKTHRLAVICEYETLDMLEERLKTGLDYWEYSDAQRKKT